MRYLLIYHYPLGATDGTSVFLRRFYAPRAATTTHLRFTALYGDDLPGARVLNLTPPRLRLGSFQRSQGTIRRLWFRHAARWILRSASKPELQAWRRSPSHRAHVVVSNEATAAIVWQLLRHLDFPPFLLHVMDILHDAGLTPRGTPQFVNLCRQAAHCLALCPQIAAELQPHRATSVEIGAYFPGVEVAFVTPSSAPFVAVMAGALYHYLPKKMAWLRTVFLPGWQQFRAKWPDSRIDYYGSDYAAFPPELKAIIHPQPFLPEADYRQRLATSNVAVLPIVHHADDRWRFSIPSRIADFVGAGLPILSYPAPDTATQWFLAPLDGKAHFVVRTPAEVCQRLHELASAPEPPRAAAREFARRELSPSATTQRLEQLLERV